MTSLAQLAPGDWDRVSGGGGLYLGEPYLRAVEDASETTTAYYVLLRDSAGRLLAGLPCYLWDGGPDPGLDHYEPYRMGGRWALSKRAREDLWRPTLLVGSRSGYRSSFALDASLENRRAQAVGVLAHEVASLAERLGAASVGWMWLEPAAAAALAANLRHPEDLVLAGPNCSIALPSDSFDSYLRRLSSSRRKSARREQDRFAASGLTVERCKLSDCLEVVAPLAVNLQRRYGHEMSAADLMRDLSAQARHLDGSSLVLVCRRGVKAVAFTLLYHWENALYGRVAGFDYQDLGDTCAYFNLAIYEPVRAAIELGVDRYHLGMASWRAKALRGAALEPAWIAVWAPSRVRGAWRRVVGHRWQSGDGAAFWQREFPRAVNPTDDWRWTVAGLLSRSGADPRT